MADPSPLVHRAVRSGGLLLVFASVQFVAAMALVQTRYPGYSLSANYISDLGGASSPWALVFDGSVILLGAVTLLGLLLVVSVFDRGSYRLGGISILLVAAVGAVGVGVFPETTHVLNGNAHAIVSAVTFIGGSLGLVVLSGAMRSGPHWRYSRPFTLSCGLVAAVASVAFLLNAYAALGPGGMERLIVAPLLLWMAAEGVHIARMPRFAPGLSLPTGSA